MNIQERLSLLWSSAYEAGKAKGMQNELKKRKMFTKKNNEDVKMFEKEMISSLKACSFVPKNAQKNMVDAMRACYVEGVACGSKDFLIKQNKPYLQLSKECLLLLIDRKKKVKMFSEAFLSNYPLAN
jgi:hypothetical protein